LQPAAGLRHVTIELAVQGDVSDVLADLRARDEVRDARWLAAGETV